jgi:D-serine deaminase-like pyridoxal phosphate-dependent protein
MDVGRTRRDARKLRMRQDGKHGDIEKLGRCYHRGIFGLYALGHCSIPPAPRNEFARDGAKRPGMTIDELDTPALLLDLDAVERNLDRMTTEFASTHVKLRPHAKTHKTATLAQMQLARGAVGICCAKLGEAQALCDGGIRDILITSELVGRTKVERAVALAKRARLTVVVDSTAVAEPLGRAAAAAGITLRTLVDVNVGQNRAGVMPGASALELATFVERTRGLQLVGLQGYEGHLQHITDAAARGEADAGALSLLCETAAAFRTAGHSTEVVTTGGTGTSRFAVGFDAITDVQPGSYAVMDAQYGAVDGLGYEYALSVLTTVISVRGGVAILDAGYKSLSDDAGPPRLLAGGAAFSFAGDEFGKLTCENGTAPAVGDKLRLIPGHCDTTINLHDEYHVHRAESVTERWTIVARGKSR